MSKNDTQAFTTKWITGSEDLKDPYYVRREVFIKEQNVSEEEEIDATDPVAHHVVVYDASKPVGTGRIFEEGGAFLIGRVAVLHEYRGKQVGKLIMEKLLERGRLLGARAVHLHAQTYATGFYEKLGFHSYGEIFLDADIEHIHMMKALE